MSATVADASVQDATAETEYGHVVYLNFSGAAFDWNVTNDSTKNKTWISVRKAATNIPAFWADDAFLGVRQTREAVISAVSERVRAAYAPFDVQIVTERPPLEQFTMAIIGGTPADVDPDMQLSSFPLGVAATKACNGSTGKDLAFVMSAVDAFRPYPDRVVGIADVAIHEVGHTFGLVHNKNSEGTFMNTGGSSRWGAGQFDPTGSQDCGRAFQDDIATLLANVGEHRPRPPVPRPPDTEAPSLEIVGLADGATLAPGYRPCAVAQDPSGIRLVTMWLMLDGPFGPVVFEQEALRAPPYRFKPIDQAFAGAARLRFTATDAWDNLREVRFSAITPGAASGATSPPCP